MKLISYIIFFFYLKFTVLSLRKSLSYKDISRPINIYIYLIVFFLLFIIVIVLVCLFNNKYLLLLILMLIKNYIILIFKLLLLRIYFQIKRIKKFEFKLNLHNFIYDWFGYKFLVFFVGTKMKIYFVLRYAILGILLFYNNYVVATIAILLWLEFNSESFSYSLDNACIGICSESLIIMTPSGENKLKLYKYNLLMNIEFDVHKLLLEYKVDFYLDPKNKYIEECFL